MAQLSVEPRPLDPESGAQISTLTRLQPGGPITI